MHEKTVASALVDLARPSTAKMAEMASRAISLCKPEGKADIGIFVMHWKSIAEVALSIGRNGHAGPLICCEAKVNRRHSHETVLWMVGVADRRPNHFPFIRSGESPVLRPQRAIKPLRRRLLVDVR